MALNHLESQETINEFIDNAINNIYDQEIWEKMEMSELTETTFTYFLPEKLERTIKKPGKTKYVPHKKLCSHRIFNKHYFTNI
jgi:hypothetical protein